MTDQQVAPVIPAQGRGFRAYTAKHLDQLTARAGLSEADRLAVRAVATVLPFRTNEYVIERLIDWTAAPDDPIYRLVFPQADMLPEADIKPIADMLSRGAPDREIQAAARQLRMRLNPHPAGQLALNIPAISDEPLPGVQHKYPETVLVFPKQGQTCHAYCTYCFRWAQFVGEPDLKMATDDMSRVTAYLGAHREVTSVLITGGDPMIMGAGVLRHYIEPLLDPRLDHIESIRIGTKSLAYWPQRFVTDPDADDTLRLFEEVAATGKTLAFMAHFSHPRELEPELVAAAVGRIRSTGAIIRTQAPLIRTINDDAQVWRDMWRAHLRLGMVPYYMFVERDTGPQGYFAVPLARAVRHLPRRLQQRVRPVPDGARAVDVGHPRQGVHRRGYRDRGAAGIRPAHDPGQGPVAGGAAVLRAVRPGGSLAVRPAAGVREPLPVRVRGRRNRRRLAVGAAGPGELAELRAPPSRLRRCHDHAGLAGL